MVNSLEDKTNCQLDLRFKIRNLRFETRDLRFDIWD